MGKEKISTLFTIFILTIDSAIDLSKGQNKSLIT